MNELNQKEVAIRDAMIAVANIVDSSQKCVIFGNKTGNWENTTGTVLVLYKEKTNYDSIDCCAASFNSIKSYESWELVRNNKDSEDYDKYAPQMCYHDCSKDSGSIHSSAFKYFIKLLIRAHSSKKYIQYSEESRLVDKYMEIFINSYNRAFSDWSGEDNNNNNRETVAMIGSCRFQKTFIEECWKLSAKGYIVTLPNFRPETMMSKGFDIPEEILEDIGCKRLAAADKVFVVNEDGYIGSSTRKEIKYAESLNKPIKYLEEV